MRILLTNIVLGAGTGTETLVRDLAPALRERGHAVTCYAPRWGRIAGEIRALGIPVVQSVTELGEPPDGTADVPFPAQESIG